jgi:hypothetical protein
MARSHHNIVIERSRGKIGDIIVKNYPYGQVLSRVPRMGMIPPSEKQLANQDRWAAAAAYYQKVKADPVLSLAYTRALKKKKGFNLPSATNRDFFRPPQVSEIDLREYTGGADQLIVIDATDDFCVAAVDVTLRDAVGNVFEYGPAWESDLAHLWHYRTKTAAPAGPVTFEAVARDLPDNRATLSTTWKPAGHCMPPTVSAPEIPDCYDPRDG